MPVTPVASLTVKEQAALPTTVDQEYSLVLALSDAGVKHMGNQTPRLQGRPPVEDDTVYLWQSGCLMDNVWNCDLACTTPANVWNGTNATFTYHNCLLQPVLALSAAEQWLVEDPPGLLEKYGISANLTAPVGDDPQRSLQWPVINRCTERFCDEIRPNSVYCQGGLGHQKLKYALGGFDPPWYPIMEVDTKFCSRGYNTPNTDLGGPGVLASYIQQLAIVILSLTFLRIPEMCLAIRQLRPKTTNKALSPWYEILWTRVEALKAHRSTAATLSALVDFQEAQIFFSLTLNIASIIALYQSKTRLMAPTVAELVANRFLFKIIGAIGSYPVVLNLCILRHNQRTLSRFILIASFCCLVLATLTWSLAIATKIESSQLQREDYRFDACGGENPMQHCFGDFAVDQTIEWWSERWSLTVFANVFLSSPPIAVPILVFAGLVAKRYTNLRTRFRSRQKHARKTPYNILAFILGLLLIVAELWLFLTTIMLLVAVSLLLVPVSHRQPHWQIGQILAVAVWIPVLVKWMHMLYGMSGQCSVTQAVLETTNGYSVVRQALTAMHVANAVTFARSSSERPVGDGGDPQENPTHALSNPTVPPVASTDASSRPDQTVAPQRLANDGLPDRAETLSV